MEARFVGFSCRFGQFELNLDAAGQTIANLVLVPIGPDGKVLLYTLEGTHLLADIAGHQLTGDR